MTRTLLQVCLLGALLSTSGVAQNYLGYLDAADCSIISGWAEDFNNPGTAINVEIWDGSTYVTTTAANLYRSDVGYHAFTISTPASLKNNQYHYIYVKYGGTNLYLYNSDRPVFCTATSNGYQYYYSDTFPRINVAAWTQNGNVSTGTGGLTNASTNDTGSLISKAAVPGSGARYEVKATLALTQAGGNYASGPNGDSAGIAYDPNTARPQSTTSPYGAVTNLTYNDTATPPTKTATTNGHWVRSSMDGFGRTIKTETGYSTTTVSTVDTVYLPCGCSPLGKMTKISQPHAPGGAQYWTTNTFDGSGRTLSTQLPDGSSTTTYVYQGNTVTVTDPAGKWKKFTVDAFGNVTSVLEPDTPTATVTTNYSYDVMNHLTQVSMPRGGSPQVRSFNYTYSNGVTVPFLLSSTNPETGTVSYTYDTNGVMLTKTDAKGQQFTYGYDAYKRMTSISVGGNVIRNFYYDTNPLDGTFSQYTSGRLTAVLHFAFVAVPGTPQISHRFAEMYSYTQAGLPMKKRLQANENVYYDQSHNHTGTINLDAIYTYDNEGKMTSANYPTTYGLTETRT